MAKALNPKVLIEGYLKKSGELDKEISQIERDLKPILQRLEQRRALEAKLEDLQGALDASEQQFSDLSREFNLALFNEAWDEQEAIQERRRDLVRRVAALEEEKASAEKELSALIVPAAESATIAAKLDMLTVPDFGQFLHTLKNALMDKQAEQSGAIHDLKINLPAFTSEEYDEARAEIDQSYASQLEAQRYRVKAEQEKRVRDQAKWKRELRHPVPQRSIVRTQTETEAGNVH